MGAPARMAERGGRREIPAAHQTARLRGAAAVLLALALAGQARAQARPTPAPPPPKAAPTPAPPPPKAAPTPAPPTAPTAKNEPQTYDERACAACHAFAKRKHVHSLIADGGCASCHLPSDEPGKCTKPAGRGWKLAAADPQLCTDCHEFAGEGPLHPAIDALGCTACHDPHGSDQPNQLVKDTVSDLCAECHEGIDTKPHVHTAVSMGECLGCHDPHRGHDRPLLKVARERVCFECHEAKDLISDRVRHAPVPEGRCLECHDPHGSENPSQTRKAGKALCLECHDAKARGGLDRPGPTKRIDLSRKTVHKPVAEGDCQRCHEQTHSTRRGALLKKRPPELCEGCHPRKHPEFVHGAVRAGDCAVCHDPHSSDQPKLLRAAGAPLCFRCHADDVTGRAFVHKPVAEGKCQGCHDPHGAAAPFNLRAGEGRQVCDSCHAKADSPIPRDPKFPHAALERYGCTACHDPHGTANRFQLVKPVNALCGSCHADHTDGLHVTTFVPGGHAVSGGPDPHDPGRGFSCASCHNPHGSDSPKLLRFGESPADTCDWCHGDRTGKHPKLKDISKRGRNGSAGEGSWFPLRNRESAKRD
ncbi:MAG: cytochrome c3 family protein [Myxococcota bacterium]